jgi:rhomboid protease GluP
VILYVIAGIAGSLLSLARGHVSVGASGAIFGLAGALVVLFSRHRGRLHLRDRRIGGVLAIWAVYQLLLGLLNPAVDNLAHLGGFLGGMVMGLLLRPAILEGRAEVAGRPLVRAGLFVSCAALLATAACVLARLAR